MYNENNLAIECLFRGRLALTCITFEDENKSAYVLQQCLANSILEIVILLSNAFKNLRQQSPWCPALNISFYGFLRWMTVCYFHFSSKQYFFGK